MSVAILSDSQQLVQTDLCFQTVHLAHCVPLRCGCCMLASWALFTASGMQCLKCCFSALDQMDSAG